MSVSLLLLTHGNIGQSIHDAAVHVMGGCPIRTNIISLHAGDDRAAVENEVAETIVEMDNGQGVLILTDMYGATPSNIACTNNELSVEIVAGLNLPMLIRIFNYPDLGLQDLKQKALSGGKEGIIQCRLEKDRYASQ